MFFYLFALYIEDLMRNSSIVRKLITYFLLLNIITVIIVGSYSYFRAKDALLERTFDQLTSIRIEKKYRIERLFEDRIEDIKLMARSEDVIKIFNLLLTFDANKPGFDTLVSGGYNSFLKRHFFTNKYYKRFFIISNEGNSLSFATSESDSTMAVHRVGELPVINLFNSIKESNKITIGDYISEKETNQAAIFIGAPVAGDDSRFLGVVATEINIEAINSIMFENNPHNGLGDSGESYLVGSDFLMRSTSRFHDNSVFKTTVRTQGVYDALDGNTGTNVIKDYRGIKVISSYSKVEIPGLDWVILAEIDEKEAMIPIYSLRNNILYLGTLMSLLLFAIVYIIARTITLPVLKLKEAAEKISANNYDVTVNDIVSRDEIGSLASAFKEMSERIKEQRENLNMERSMRLSSMIDGQELERLRLSRELHDGLGQSILAVKMRLERCSNAPPPKAREIMEEINLLITNIITEIRSISNNLMPAELSQFGLVDALKNLCRNVSMSSGLTIHFSSSDVPDAIDDRINTYLYRIAQEGLNNIIKHSGAESASIAINWVENELILQIIDRGSGFNYNNDRKLCGNGIANMKERVQLLGGEFELLSAKGDGTRISIRLRINDKNG